MSSRETIPGFTKRPKEASIKPAYRADFINVCRARYSRRSEAPHAALFLSDPCDGKPFNDDAGEVFHDDAAAWEAAVRLTRDIENALEPGEPAMESRRVRYQRPSSHRDDNEDLQIAESLDHNEASDNKEASRRRCSEVRDTMIDRR